MNEEVEKLKEKISNILEKNFVGKANTVQTRDAMIEALEGYAPDDSDYQVGTATDKWSTFSWHTKLKWYVTNKIFPWIAKDVRQHHDTLNAYITELYEHWEELDSPYYSITEYRQKLPEWAISSPKDEIVIDVYIRPAQALEFIPIKFKIEDLKESK